MANAALVGSIDSNELARCLFDEANDALIVVDPRSLRLLDVNPLAQKLTKRTRKNLLSLSMTALFASDNSTLFREFVESCRETRVYHSRESHQLIRDDGTFMEVNVSVSRLHTTPAPLALVSVRDVSQRKALEEQLKRTQIQLSEALQEKTSDLEITNNELLNSEHRLRELLDDVDAIVWEAPLPFVNFTFVSKQAERILGYSTTRWIEEPNFWVKHIHESDVARCRDECQQASMQGVDHELQYRMLSSEGREVWLRDIIHIVKDDQGHPVKLRGVMIDVTQQVEWEQTRIHLDTKLRKNERQLAHIARLSTMGEMIAGISHEINQPLSAISNFASAALQMLEGIDVKPNDPLAQWMQQISDQAIRCGDIIRRLRGFSRKNDLEETVLNVRHAIDESKFIIRDLLQEHAIDFEIDVADDSWIQINDAEFQQVLVNLVRNACEAVVEGNATQPRIRIKSTLIADRLELIVEDNGPGVDAKFVDSIFDPFVTTRRNGMGMGLGISRSIVRNHHGDLSLDADYTEGACFCIELPLANRKGSESNG